MPRPVIIDCDPGIDDCVALMVALASRNELGVEAICTVAGNVNVATCTRNVLGLLALLGRVDVPVYSGCERPMSVNPVFADHIHGENGLGSVCFPAAQTSAATEDAVDYLIRRLADSGQPPATLVIVGPSTNLATALQKAPDITAGIEQIVLMGGARREGGNITPSAEFNIYADPHAAQTVFHGGRPLTVIGLDATLQLRCSPDRMAALRAIGNAASKAAADMMEHVNAIYGEIYGTAGAAMHDPCTIAWLLAPDLFHARPVRIEVETASALTRGHTAVDYHHTDDRPANANWVDGLESDKVFALLLERIARL
ncbi:nucleoside hydrolase [Hyphobacterium sp.]|uniref:nucleoside hydrolase n=1 Tax=Hyphobacterium sp. TaxID=2004662 RepID=UPI0037491160